MTRFLPCHRRICTLCNCFCSHEFAHFAFYRECRLSRPMTILMKMALASACSERLMLTMAGLQAHARQQQCIRQWYSASSALLLAKRRGKGGEGGEGGCGRRAHANRSTASAESVRLDGISASARWRVRLVHACVCLYVYICVPLHVSFVVGEVVRTY